ncbi:hypothetical protein P1X15_16960 [Runella sp. MFBS21]|uniref:hypothetical protein n=1 Tax=Runella sp. MFBS21 TaxID=3034018 RepID=UPI0023F95A4B|nr:hypothetical protein [Runella sp. MFBS21]MDF7819310.1 hypothetical protein [Runella sp. MFBS21]
MPNYSKIFDGEEPITQQEFEDWHEQTVLELVQKQPHFSVGWAAQTLDYFLQTAVKLAGFGRPNLQKWLHPVMFCGQENGGPRDSYQTKLSDITSYSEYKILINSLNIKAKQYSDEFFLP